MAGFKASSVMTSGRQILPRGFCRQITFASTRPPYVMGTHDTTSYFTHILKESSCSGIFTVNKRLLQTAARITCVASSTSGFNCKARQSNLCLGFHRAKTFPLERNILHNLGDRCSSTTTRSASSKAGSKTPKRKWLRYLGTSVLVLIGCGVGYVAYKLFYDFPRRGVKVFYIPKLPLQFAGPCGTYKGTTVFTTMLSSIERCEDFQVRPDDVFVCSYPRSGTTWTQEVVYLICHQVDIDKAKSQTMEDRFPYLEDTESPVDRLNAAESPRLIKTHLPYRLLPKDVHNKNPKMIYIVRNPKDVMVSSFHFYSNLSLGYYGSFTEFADIFLRHSLLFSPWLDHVKGYWEKRDENNILVITYEDMSRNLAGEVEKIAKFLDRPLTSEQIATIVDHCSFDSMKKNDKVNYNWWKERGFISNRFQFMRKGKVGDWKNHVTPEIEKRLKEEVQRPLAEVGLELKDEVDKVARRKL